MPFYHFILLRMGTSERFGKLPLPASDNSGISHLPGKSPGYKAAQYSGKVCLGVFFRVFFITNG